MCFSFEHLLCWDMMLPSIVMKFCQNLVWDLDSLSFLLRLLQGILVSCNCLFLSFSNMHFLDNLWINYELLNWKKFRISKIRLTIGFHVQKTYILGKKLDGIFYKHITFRYYWFNIHIKMKDLEHVFNLTLKGEVYEWIEPYNPCTIYVSIL